jgi:hypothetical protein
MTLENKILIICCLVAIVAISIVYKTYGYAFAQNNTTKISDCVMIHGSLLGLKLTEGNQTTLNGHLVHNTAWYKMFEVYNKPCANLTGYLQP